MRRKTVIVDLTEKERLHLINKLMTGITHRHAILNDPDAADLGCNIRAITEKMRLEEEILAKLQK